MALTPSQEIDKFINDLTDWRGTWIAENNKVDEAALKELIRAAVDFNISSGKKK